MLGSKEKYHINQSPLYKIKSKTRLAEILQFDVNLIGGIIADENYHVFKNANDRWIQCPLNELRSIHDRLQSYMVRIQIPDYVHSKKGKSYITNAMRHSAELPFIKTDISKFYPSTSFSAVYNLFNQIFKCSPDVGWLLATLCCFQGRRLPTGSPISGSIAFLAHQPMFDQIDVLSKSKGCIFTLFVDDIGISGFSASKSLLYQIRGIINSYGLITSDKKSKTYGLGRPRRHTGVILTVNGPKVPNKRLLKIHRLEKEIQALPASKKKETLKKSLKGSMQAASEINKANVQFTNHIFENK
jgi:hypothetical protein